MSSWFQSAPYRTTGPCTLQPVPDRQHHKSAARRQPHVAGIRAMEGAKVRSVTDQQRSSLLSPDLPSVDSPIKTPGHENLWSCAAIRVHLRNGLWFSFSNTNTQAEDAETHSWPHARTHSRSHTLTITRKHPRLCMCSPTHHSIAMLSDCFPPLPLSLSSVCSSFD